MSKKILVIDDERDVLELVRTVLKAKGYMVACAEGGEEGLRLAERDHPDLIISDLMMPKVSGLELVKRLKKHQRLRTIPIIIMSALSADDERPEHFWAAGLGVDDYITKPFDPLDLLGRVEYIFRRSKYLSSKSDAVLKTDSTASDVGPNASASDAFDFGNATPTEVVKLYVEAWNSQDFLSEFLCLALDSMGPITKDQYLARREQTYREEKGHSRQQRVTKIVSENISANLAKVALEREDIVDGRTWRKADTYTLKKTGEGWKILKYTSEPIRRTVPVPEEDE